MLGLIWQTPKRGGKIVRGTVSSYRGSAPYLDLREWYLDGEGELKPGKGCTVPMEGIVELHAALGQLLTNIK